MWSELLETESYALLLFVEVEDDDVDLLVEFHHFFRIAYAAPREVCDVYETVNTAEVDEYTVGCDVLNHTFENLAFLELADDFFLLCFDFCFDECFVRYDHVFEVLVDLDNLELHSLADKCVVVVDRTYVDLASWQECFGAEYVDDHTSLSAALDESLDDFA